jgi:hypothetical protein
MNNVLSQNFDLQEIRRKVITGLVGVSYKRHFLLKDCLTCQKTFVSHNKSNDYNFLTMVAYMLTIFKF